MAANDFDPLIEAAGAAYNVDPRLIKAVGLQESGLNPNTPDSPKGAQGMMQIMPVTAQHLRVNPYDPPQAIDGAARYLAEGLDEADGLRARGVNVDPAAYAAMYYNGPAAARRGAPEVQQYAAQVAQHYRQLAPFSPQPTAELPASGPGLGSARNPYPYEQRNAAGPDDFVQSAPGLDVPMLRREQQLQERHGVTPAGGRGLPLDSSNLPPSLAALAQAGTTAPATTAPGPAAPAGGGAMPDIAAMSDDDLIKGITGGQIPWTPKAAPPPASAAASAPTPMAPGVAAIGIPQMIDDYNFYNSFPGGREMAQTIYQGILKQAPEGFQLNKDGTLSVRPGYASGEGEVAGAKATAEQTQQRITQHVAPQKFAPGETFAPYGAATPGMPGAPGGPPAGTFVATPSKEVGDMHQKLADAAAASRQGLGQMDAMREALGNLGRTGPGVPQLAAISAWAESAGVPQKTIDALHLPSGAAAEQVEKNSATLLGETVKAMFPGQRITNQEMSTFRLAVPGIGLLPAANEFLINRVMVPQMWREVERGDAMSGNRAAWRDPQTYAQALSQWDAAHPISNYVAAMRSAPGLRAAAPGGGVAAPGGVVAAPGGVSGGVVAAPGGVVAAPGGGAAGRPQENWRFDPSTRRSTLTPSPTPTPGP